MASVIIDNVIEFTDSISSLVVQNLVLLNLNHKEYDLINKPHYTVTIKLIVSMFISIYTYTVLKTSMIATLQILILYIIYKVFRYFNVLK